MGTIFKKKEIKTNPDIKLATRISIKSVSDFKEYADKKEANVIYRGISNEEELLPKIVRFKCQDKEFEILEEFEKYVSIFSGVKNCWEFLELAQHYGLYTRLIDFTKNIYIALFFALFRENDDGYYRIICLKNINKMKIYSEFDPSLLEVYANILDKPATIKMIVRNIVKDFSTNLRLNFDDYKKDIMNGNLCVIEPHMNNQRILMQEGTFVIPRLLDEELILNAIYSKCDILEISKEARNGLLQYLDSLGINSLKLMPDIENLCNTINKKYEKRQSK